MSCLSIMNAALVSTVALLGLVTACESLELAAAGASTYSIVISTDANPGEIRAADELQHFLEEMTGARLPILLDDVPATSAMILLGNSAHLRAAMQDLSLDGLGDEGFVIKTAGNHLIIAGPGKRGTMYGVYAFLEEQLGCRWFAPGVSTIPRQPHLEISPLDIRHSPTLEYREVYYGASQDLDWCTRNRLNGNLTELDEDHGGKIAYEPFVHSYWKLIPPETYFEPHPEWFSMVDGKRTLTGRYKRTQLCLTNETMIQEAIKNTRQWIIDNPTATIFSISQNDGPGGWCECEQCAALEKAQGGAHAAPVLYFVNRIAEALGTEYPGVAFDTLAYGYTLQAPTDLKPLPNVIVRMCTSGCKSHTFDDEKCPENLSIRTGIRDWFRLTNRIYVWDYTINFRQYLLPFPNLHTIGPNIQFFAQHGVRGIFEQGSGEVSHSDMGPLRTYMLAKMLWNPDCDREVVMREFLEAWFGPAAEPMRAYIALLENEVGGEDYPALHLKNFEPKVEAAYLGPRVLSRATSLFHDAEARCEDVPVFLNRVQQARLSLDYVKVSLAANLSAMVGDDEAGLPVRDYFRKVREDFFSTASRTGVEYVREASRSNSKTEDFRKILEADGRAKEGSGAEIE